MDMLDFVFSTVKGAWVGVVEGTANTILLDFSTTCLNKFSYSRILGGSVLSAPVKLFKIIIQNA